MCMYGSACLHGAQRREILYWYDGVAVQNNAVNNFVNK